MNIENWVLGKGPSNSKLMVVGEAPGKKEEEIGQPFVGPTGELLDELLGNAKLSRSQVYLTNVVKVRPPNNDLEKLGELGYKIDDFLPLLNTEIEVLRPNVILAVGSLALKHLTGKEGIRSWRGSILSGPLNIKTIPTIHPAALFERNYGENSGQGMFTWKQKSHIQFDIIKAARECLTPSWDSVFPRNCEIIRSSLNLERFFNLYKDYKKVYVDTEVFKAHLVCIGFAFTRYHGCSIPLIDLQSNENYKGINLHELVDIWQIVAEKLADPRLEKAGQNFKSDKVYWLEETGFEVNNFSDDGMFKMHTLSPELDKSLAFQTSLFTNIPYYKHEGKEYNPYKDNMDVLLKYNAMDCIANCECIEEMDKDMEELGLMPFYQEYVMGMYPIYEAMEKGGWLISKEKRKELYDNYTELLEFLKQELRNTLAELGIEGNDGEDWNYNSPPQITELIYVKMRCPSRKDTGDETLTALMNNAVKDIRKKKVIRLVLDLRSVHKVRSTYVDADIDYDDRMRWQIKQVGTETGRTSTATIKKPLRNGTWGVPIQTIPRPGDVCSPDFLEKLFPIGIENPTDKERDIHIAQVEKKYNSRSMYIPDPGNILFEMDQSQAEARIVALLANDLNLLKLFDLTDVHKLTASFLYGITSRNGVDLIESAIRGEKFIFLDQVTELQRQIGKNSRHGAGYDLGEEGLSIKMKISLYRAKMAMQKIHEMSPNIRQVFHEDVQTALLENNRTLMTPFGRRREFFNKWGKELFREAYAHIPQSVIGDNTKRVILAIKKLNIDWFKFLAEVHDSFIGQLPENRVEEFYWIAKPLFEQPIDFERCTLKRPPVVIPVDCKIGYNWGEMEKKKFK